MVDTHHLSGINFYGSEFERQISKASVFALANMRESMKIELSVKGQFVQQMLTKSTQPVLNMTIHFNYPLSSLNRLQKFGKKN